MSGLFSVIIPTIQKNLNVLHRLITVLQSDDIVGEILVINNGETNLPMDFYIDKVVMFKTKQNLYVNKSWNFGVANSKFDNLLIINDDILPVEKLCTIISNTGLLDMQDTGLAGINTYCISQYNRENAPDINIPTLNATKFEVRELDTYLNLGDWGSAFFLKKQNYYKIPEDLKIIYGDNYLLYKNLINNKINYEISGLPFNHIHSLSSASVEFQDIISNDINNARKYLPEV